MTDSHNGASSFTLGGKTFHVIAPLSLRQVVRIGPLLPDVLATLNRRAAVAAAVPRGEDGAPHMTDEEGLRFLADYALTEAETEKVLTVVLNGVSRKDHPGLTIEDLWSLPARADDLILAVNVVMTASHLTRLASENVLGEAAATTRSIGAGSSLN